MSMLLLSISKEGFTMNHRSKKLFYCLISLIMLFVISFGLIPQAAADVSINNGMIGQDNSAATPALPSWQTGRELIMATGDGYRIELPLVSSYLPSPMVMYVESSGKHSNYAFSVPYRDMKKVLDYPYHGSKVLVLAKQNGFACILYHNSLNEKHAAWVDVGGLSGYYPGITASTGTPCVSYARCCEGRSWPKGHNLRPHRQNGDEQENQTRVKQQTKDSRCGQQSKSNCRLSAEKIKQDCCRPPDIHAAQPEKIPCDRLPEQDHQRVTGSGNQQQELSAQPPDPSGSLSDDGQNIDRRPVL